MISASHEEVDVPKWSIRIKSVVLFVNLAIIIVAAIFIATNFLEFLPLISSLIMLMFFYMMYRALSFRRHDWSFGLLGAMFSTICIMGLATLFVTIVKYFTSYQDVYTIGIPCHIVVGNLSDFLYHILRILFEFGDGRNIWS